MIGVFGYSDEDGTEAAGFDGKLDQEIVDERVRVLTELAEELTAQRAEERIGTEVDVLIEDDLGDGGYEGRAAHQGPEVDGSVHGPGHRPGPGPDRAGGRGRRRGGRPDRTTSRPVHDQGRAPRW